MNPYAANNPFSAPPQSRYPDITSASPDPSAAQFTQWLQPGGAQSPMGAGMGMGQHPQFQQQQPPFQQQQMSPQYGSPPVGSPFGGAPQQQQQQQQQQGFGMHSPTGFQPTSSFGQQLAAGQVSGSSYGYLHSGGGSGFAPQGAAYNPAQQQLQSPGYVAQFDPYGSIAQGWDGSSPPPQQQQQQQPGSGFMQSPMSPGGAGPPAASSTSPTGQLHPREFVRVHKNQVDSWDQGTWTQLLGTFDALKDAWEARKKDILGNVAQLQQQLQYSGYYAGQMQQEIARLQGLAKDAESNHDSVAASSFQMHEVFSNYRSAGDANNKRLVREASNAALSSLPEWPPLAY